MPDRPWNHPAAAIPGQLRSGLVGLVSVLLTLIAVAPTAHARMDQMDQGALIEGLKDRGMAELLEHLLQDEGFGDPILRRQALISQLLIKYDRRLRASNETDDAQRSDALRQEATDAFKQAMSELRSLIDDHPEHPSRPMWQTTLAEQLLFERLQNTGGYAGQFYTLGVPTQEQAELFEQDAVEALEQAVAADLRFFELRTKLPQDPDYTQKYVNSGLANRMFDEYYAKRTQYFLSLAALYVAAIGDDQHPYYQTLKQNEVIPPGVQKSQPEQERRRLFQLAADRTNRMIQEVSDLSDSIEHLARAVRGRGLTRVGQGPQAEEALAPVLEDARGDIAHMEAQMALVLAREEQDQSAAADQALDQILRHPMVSQSLTLRLLVTDLEHLIQLRRAHELPEDQQQAAVSDAYGVYLELLDDPRVGERKESLRQFIYQRWENSIRPDQPLDAMPDLVMLAVGQTGRQRGQNLVVEAGELREQGEEEAAAATQAEGEEKLTNAKRVLEALIPRESADDEMTAMAMYNRALCTYFLGINDRAQKTEAANQLVELAYKFPEQEVAEQAIAEGVSGILRPMYEATAPAIIKRSYRNGARVMFNLFNDTPAADDERLFYAERVLMMEQNNWGGAVQLLQPLAPEHPDYWGSRQLLAQSLERWYTQVDEQGPAAPVEAAATDTAAEDGDADAVDEAEAPAETS